MNYSKQLCLNLGSGNLPKQSNPTQRWINIDISETCDPDVVVDITEGLPYKNDSIEEVHAGCVLEQIGLNHEFIFVLNEIWRVLKPDGVFTGYVPSTDPEVLHLDPMDKRFFQEESFDYFDYSKHAWQEFGKNYGFLGWKVTSVIKNDNGIIHFHMRPFKQ